MCNRQGHWARECCLKECKRGADGKAIITREDREKVRETHVHDVGVEEWPDDESGWETFETYGLGLYIPICTDMLSVIDDPPPGLQPGVGKGYTSTRFLDPRPCEDESEDEAPLVGLHESLEKEDPMVDQR